MSPKQSIVTAGLVALVLGGAASSGAAQPAQSRPPVAHPFIEINPRPLVRRRCTSWYMVQYRPSGTVLFPERHCWWVR
jgi:hypothetical protein